MHKPQAPRDVRLLGATAESLTIQWLPPVYDGGTPVFDYDVACSFCHKVSSAGAPPRRRWQCTDTT